MAVTLDATLSVNISVNTGTSFSDSTHMTIGGSANALVALVSWGFHAGDNPPAGRSITWNGVSMTLVPGTSVTDANGETTEIYALLNPATGTHAFAGSWTNTHDCLATCLSYIGVDTSFSNAFVGNSASITNSSAPSVSVASTANSLVAGADASNTLSFSATSGTTIYNVNTLPTFTGAAMRDTGAAPTKSVSATSNAGTDDHAISIVSVNPPLPFPAVDFSRPYDIPSGQTPQFPNLAITVAPSTNAFAREPLFNKQFDIPGLVWQPLGSPEALLAGAPPAAPFYTRDFSDPFFPPPAVAATSLLGTNIKLFTNPIPIFNPFIQPPDGFGPSVAEPFQTSSLTLTANLGPWTQTNFSKPANYLPNPPLAVAGTNVNLFTNPIPFGPYDWSRPALFQPAPPPASQATPLVQFANLGPFTQPQPPPVWRCPAAPAIALPSNIALLTAAAVTAPVIPYDFSKPFFPSVATDKTQPTNINLFTNPIPFYPVDLSKPFFPGNVPAVTLPVNPNLYTVSATPVPFSQTDWSKSYFSLAPSVDTYTLLFFPAPPIIPVDTSYTSQPRSSSPHPYTLNIALTSATVPAAPIIPLDTSYTSQPRPSLAHPYTLNVALTSTAVPAPFVAIDWSKPFFPRAAAVDPTSGSVNTNLLTNPIPFGPYDYNRQFQAAPERQRPRPDGTNINLFANPIPFANSMDFRSPAQPQWRTWDQGPPNMVLLTTPPPVPPVTTQQPPYFFNLSFGKLSGF